MIVYNVTVKVDHSIASAWIKWLKQEHIPELVATGCFTHAIVFHLLEDDDTEGITYAVQYYAESMDMYNKYIEKYANEMRQKGFDKWGDKFIAFRTIMQVVD